MIAKRTVLLAMLTVCVVISPTAGLVPTEYEVKAALIYNLAKFVEWPPSALPDAQPNLLLCVLGHDPFGANLEQTIAGKLVHGKALTIRRFHKADNAHGCHIVFISSSERGHLAQLLNAFQGGPVLTIGEMEQFATRGGMVNFIIEDNRVQFEINIDAAERAGLKISSRALKLARVVRSLGQ
jgi:hypothetical protein